MVSTHEIGEAIEDEKPIISLHPDYLREFGDSYIASSSQIIRLSSDHREQAENIVTRCAESFPKEGTLVESTLGVSSILVRLDCTVSDTGIEVFECEERPAGIGVTDLVLRSAGFEGFAPAIHDHYQDYFGVSPVVVRHPNAKINDDSVMFDVIEASSDLSIPLKPLIARGEPSDFSGESYRDRLVEWSVSTVMTKGQKAHTVSIPDLKAKIATQDNIPPPEESFTIKPVAGSKARGVFVYLSPPDRKRHGKHGTRTHAKVINTVAEQPRGSFIIEEFKAPVRVNMPDEKIGNLILRLFALIHPEPPKRATVIGGSYVARPELVVHGATNAINGPIIVD